MTSLILMFLGILIGLFIQAALDYKTLDDIEKDVDRLEEKYEAFVQKIQEDKKDADQL